MHLLQFVSWTDSVKRSLARFFIYPDRLLPKALPLGLLATGCICLASAQPPAVDSLLTHDTAGVDAPDTTVSAPVADSLPPVATFGIDSLAQPAALADTLSPKAPADTGAPDGTFFVRPHVALSTGWRLGSFPLFNLWQRDLPRSLGAFGITSDDIFATDSAGRRDSTDIDFTLREPPNPYNMAFPVGVGLCIPFDTLRRIVFEGSFMFMQKTFQAVIEADTLDNIVKMQQRLGLYAPWAAVTLYRTLSPHYFTIKDTRFAQINTGLAVAPRVWINRTTRVTRPQGRRNDHFGPALDSALADHEIRVINALPQYRTAGWAVSWHGGLSAIKFYSPHAGIEAGLQYNGSYFWFPRSSPAHIANNAPTYKNDPLRFATHQFTIRIAFLRGKKTKPPAELQPDPQQ